jgi:hypothetical protein
MAWTIACAANLRRLGKACAEDRHQNPVEVEIEKNSRVHQERSGKELGVAAAALVGVASGDCFTEAPADPKSNSITATGSMSITHADAQNAILTALNQR